MADIEIGTEKVNVDAILTKLEPVILAEVAEKISRKAEAAERFKNKLDFTPADLQEVFKTKSSNRDNEDKSLTNIEVALTKLNKIEFVEIFSASAGPNSNGFYESPKLQEIHGKILKMAEDKGLGVNKYDFGQKLLIDAGAGDATGFVPSFLVRACSNIDNKRTFGQLPPAPAETVVAPNDPTKLPQPAVEAAEKSR